jgi:hypothetical protein
LEDEETKRERMNILKDKQNKKNTFMKSACIYISMCYIGYIYEICLYIYQYVYYIGYFYVVLFDAVLLGGVWRGAQRILD